MLQWVQWHVTVVGACCRRHLAAAEEARDCVDARGNGGAKVEQDRVAGGPAVLGERSGRSELARSTAELWSVTGEDDYSGRARSGTEALN